MTTDTKYSDVLSTLVALGTFTRRQAFDAVGHRTNFIAFWAWLRLNGKLEVVAKGKTRKGGNTWKIAEEK